MKRIHCSQCDSTDIRMIGRADWGEARPWFECFGCHQQFTAGHTGGEVGDYCRERQANRKPHEPHFWNEGVVHFDPAKGKQA